MRARRLLHAIPLLRPTAGMDASQTLSFTAATRHCTGARGACEMARRIVCTRHDAEWGCQLARRLDAVLLQIDAAHVVCKDIGDGHTCRLHLHLVYRELTVFLVALLVGALAAGAVSAALYVAVRALATRAETDVCDAASADSAGGYGSFGPKLEIVGSVGSLLDMENASPPPSPMRSPEGGGVDGARELWEETNGLLMTDLF